MVERERSRAGWKSWDEVRAAAQDNRNWKTNVEAFCANWHERDRLVVQVARVDCKTVVIFPLNKSRSAVSVIFALAPDLSFEDRARMNRNAKNMTVLQSIARAVFFTAH